MVRTTATASLSAAPWWPCDLSASTLAAHVGRGSGIQWQTFWAQQEQHKIVMQGTVQWAVGSAFHPI
jgi:hypothetical protein